MNFEEQTIKEFERRGAEDVQRRLQSGLIAASQIQLALDWLREQDAAAAERDKWMRSQTMKSEMAEKRKRTTIDKIIIALAASTLIAQVLSWLCPRH